MSNPPMERAAGQVLAALEQAGHEAYLVGGCVRDKLLGRPVKDLDIATSAAPEQVAALFPRVIPTGLRHGTVTVRMDGFSFEVTTFRTEGSYEAYRRPSEVRFVSELKEDLQRRDFTMNAMAMDRDGRLIDPFKGREDMAAGVLRCVGQAADRFREDALRMLRGIRFAAEYGYGLEETVWQALQTHGPLLRHIAMERVRMEMERILAGRHPARGLALLLASGLPHHFKRGLGLPYERWAECRAAGEESGGGTEGPAPVRYDGEWREPERLLLPRLQGLNGLRELAADEHRWAYMWMYAGVTKEQAVVAMRRLTCSRRLISAMGVILELDKLLLADDSLKPSEQDDTALDPIAVRKLREKWVRAAVAFGKPVLSGWLELRKVLESRPGKEEEAANKPVRLSVLVESGGGWLMEIPVDRLDQLAVTGSDIARAAGRSPGPWLGRVLSRLLEDAAFRRTPNERTALLDKAVEYARLDDEG